MKGKDINVSLNEHELVMAANVGVRRHADSLFRERKDAHGLSSDGWNEHIMGACGELAFAKAANLFWNGSVNTFNAPDVGKIQVRTRSGIGGREDLIIRSSDNPMEIFVLVIGKARIYTICGWILARDARRPEWVQTYGGRPPAWFVPRAAVLPFPLTIADISRTMVA